MRKQQSYTILSILFFVFCASLRAEEFHQNFEGFNNGQSWYLTDFSLGEKPKKSEFTTEDGEILFKLNWTKQTKKIMAELGAESCDPLIEVGKASTYASGSGNNFIAELDSDLKHCGAFRTKPATLRLKSFIPTKPGYVYRLSFDYKMRSYGANAHRNLIAKFGREKIKLDPVNNFQTVELDSIALGKYSKLIFKDNGLPDSFGVLLDNIHVQEVGKSENYDECAQMFAAHSKGFRKCIKGEIALGQTCDFNSLETLFIQHKVGGSVASNRLRHQNLINHEGDKNGSLNFLSLGLKGKLNIKCLIDGHKAITPVYGKTLQFQEVTWGNQSYKSYPERAIVKVKLINCLDSSVNGVKKVGEIKTKDLFQYSFDDQSYEGCMLKKIHIRDRTPKGPSGDGIDLNSFQLN